MTQNYKKKKLNLKLKYICRSQQTNKKEQTMKSGSSVGTEPVKTFLKSPRIYA